MHYALMLIYLIFMFWLSCFVGMLGIGLDTMMQGDNPIPVVGGIAFLVSLYLFCFKMIPGR
jgi:hypothetical protein